MPDRFIYHQTEKQYQLASALSIILGSASLRQDYENFSLEEKNNPRKHTKQSEICLFTLV
jgi:hypothetical protein